jgi:hypothetical protein
MNLCGMIGAHTVAAVESTTLTELLQKQIADDRRYLLDIKIATVAVADGTWRFCTDAEITEATAALTKLVGREGKMPSWQRRLARRIDVPEWLLTIESLYPTPGTFPPTMPPTTRAIAVPLEVGVAILRSPNNPEPVIARLREAFSAWKLADEEKAAKREAEKRQNDTAERKLEIERVKYHAAEWCESTIDERFAILLAIATEKTPGDPAANVRAALAGSRKPGDFPRLEWWKGTGLLDRLNAPKTAEEEKRAQQAALAEMEKVPFRTRDLLWIRHGSDYVAQLKTWKMLQAQQ